MTIAFVQDLDASTSANVSVVTLTLGAGVNTTAGNTVIVRGHSTAGNVIKSITDTKGNTYNQDINGTAAAATACIWSAQLTTALVAGNTITVTFNSAKSQTEAAANEFSGLATSSFFDQNADQVTTSGTSVTVATASNTSQASELVITCAGASTSGTWTHPSSDPDSGGTWTSFSSPTTTIALQGSYQIASATSMFSAAWTCAAVANIEAVIATYKGAGGASTQNGTATLTGAGTLVGTPPVQPLAPYTLGQANAASGNSTVQFTVTATSKINDTVVVAGTYATSGTNSVTGVTDSQGNTYSAVISDYNQQTGIGVYSAVCNTALVSGTDWINVAFQAAIGTKAVGARGCSGVGLIDQTASNDNASSTSPSAGPTGTLSKASSWGIAWLVNGNGGGVPSAWTGGFTATDISQHPTGNQYLTVADQITAATTALTAGATITAARWAMLVTTFPASGATPALLTAAGAVTASAKVTIRGSATLAGVGALTALATQKSTLAPYPVSSGSTTSGFTTLQTTTGVAPTIAGYQETTWSGSGAKSTPSISWQAGDLVAVLGANAQGAVSIPSFTVTATQGGVVAPGMSATLHVVTGASASQPGTTLAWRDPSGNLKVSGQAIIPAATGSMIYGAFIGGIGTTSPFNANTTFLQNVATLDLQTVQLRSTSTTTAGVSVTLGTTAPTAIAGALALCEVKITGTWAVDSSTPPVLHSTSATHLTTASFQPPPGSLLVLMVSTEAASGTTTMGVADTSGLGLSWTEQIKQNATAEGYVGVWTAAVPTGGALPIANPTATGLSFTPGTVTGASSLACWGRYWTASPSAGGSAVVSSTGSSSQWGMAVWVIRGATGLGNVSETDPTSVDTASAISLTRSGSHSLVLGIFADFLAASPTGYSFTPALGSAGDDREHLLIPGQFTVYVADWADQGNTGTASYGVSGISNGAMTKIALEITAAAGASTVGDAIVVAAASDTGTDTVTGVTDSQSNVYQPVISDYGIHSMTVTATAGGSVTNGILLRVRVLTGAAIAQNGGTGTQSGVAAHTCTVATTTVGSYIYGATANGFGGGTSGPPLAADTLVDDVIDAGNSAAYGTLRTTAATGATSGYSLVVLGDNPSVYYRLGDSAAPAVSSAGGVSAAMSGTVGFGQPGALVGDSDTACSFPGTGTDYLQTASSPGSAYDLGDGPFSIEFWYKAAQIGVAQTVLSKVSTAYIVLLNSANKWVLHRAGGSDCFVTTATFPDTASWHHVVITRAAASQPHIYVDGVNQAGSYTVQTFLDNTNGFALGINPNHPTTDPFSGLLDEVALYKSVLSQTQVTTHYTAGTAGSGSVKFGTVASFTGGTAAAEILPAVAGTPTVEDASGPAAASTTSGTSIATGSFTPPFGSLLIACVAANGSTGSVTMGVSGGGLTWTPLAEAHNTSQLYAGVWVAQMTPGTGGVAAFAAFNTTPLVFGTDWIRATFSGSAGGKTLIARGCTKIVSTDQLAANDSLTGVSPSAGPSGTLVQASEWALAFLVNGNAGGVPSAWTGGFLPKLTAAQGGFGYLTAAEQVTGSTAALTAGATIVSSYWEMLLVVLKAGSPPTTVSITGAGALTSSSLMTFRPPALLTGAGALTVTPTRPGATLTGAGALTAKSGQPGVSFPSGIGTVTATPALQTPATPYTIGGAGIAPGSSAVIFTVTTTTAAGDAIAVAASSNTFGETVTSITDSKGNTYFPIISDYQQQTGISAYAALNTKNLVAGTDWIEASFSGSSGSKVILARGCNKVVSVDQNTANDAASGLFPTAGPTGTLDQSSEWAIAFLVNGNAGGFPGNWTGGFVPQFSELSSAGNQYLSVADQITSHTTALTAGASITSARWAMLVVTLNTGVTGSAVITGAGALTGIRQPSAAAVITGAGALTALMSQAWRSVLPSAGVLQAIGGVGSTVSCAGASTLTSLSVVIPPGDNHPAGIGTLTALAVIRLNATITGAGALNGSAGVKGAGSLTGTGALTASAVVVVISNYNSGFMTFC